MTSFKRRSGAAQGEQAIRLASREISRCRTDTRLLESFEMQQMLAETVVAPCKSARWDQPFHALDGLLAGPFVADAAAHEVALEYLFEGHPHAFRVFPDIDHASSSTLGAAGAKSTSTAATLW